MHFNNWKWCLSRRENWRDKCRKWPWLVVWMVAKRKQQRRGIQTLSSFVCTRQSMEGAVMFHGMRKAMSSLGDG
jgi:hypothetical protein